MSGSNNRPGDPRLQPPQGMRLEHDPHLRPQPQFGTPGQQQPAHRAPMAPHGSQGPSAGPPGQQAAAPGPGPGPAPEHLPAPPGKLKRGRKDPGGEPIVPATSVTGSSLTLVIAIMTFLACLTAGAVYMMTKSASAWLRNVASEVTVQVEPRANIPTDRVIKNVIAVLQRTDGIANIRPMSVADSSALLEPWLGSSDVLKALPVPRIIALELNRSAPPDFGALRTKLAASFKGVTLDDHRQWQREIKTVTGSFALGGLAILFLVGAATTAIIVSAARASMASNKDIVEVLHFVGATDKFIAHEFERHFLRLGIRAGVLGAALAMAVFFIMPLVMQFFGGGAATATEINRLIGTDRLDLVGYIILGVVVAVVALLCMVTSRLGVYRILNARH